MRSFTNMKNERGNALFLILIAVALFAALSYAVTQSGRGGGSIDKEQSLIVASQVTQFPAAVRTGVTRMVITGTQVTDLDFGATSTGADAVFDSAGGGVIYQSAPSNAGGDTTWYFLEDGDNFFIDDIGTNTTNDVMAVLGDVSQTVCDQVNKGLGLTTGGANAGTVAPLDGTAHTTATPAATNTFDAYSGEPFACSDNGAENVYYHALVEQ